MVHIAYDVKEIIKSCPVKIESIGLWGPRLLLACIDGSLRIYGPDSQQQDDDEECDSDAIQKSDTYKLQRTLIGFSKKPVSCMDMLRSRKLLITLSDAVTVHKLPGFDAVAYLAKTKGATLYAWDEKLGLLCAAKQKRLFIFQHDGAREFSELKELAAPDIVKSMAWCGDSLCLGIRREYVILNMNTGVAIEVFPCGRIASPSVVPLPNGELLLGKDNVGVFIDHNGKLTHPGGVTWSEVPGLVVIHPPYALARLSRFIEVRYLQSPHSLVQMLPLREIQLLPSSGNLISSGPQVLVASDNSVYGLLAVPLGVQVVQLAASRSFDEALALCKLLPPEDAALRAAKEDDIHIRYGYFLFEQGEYTQAMQHFAVSSLELQAVLSLFPSIKLPSFCSSNATGTLLEASPIGTSSETSSAEVSSDFENSETDQFAEEKEVEGNRKSPEKTQNIIAVNALAGFLMAKRCAVVGKAEAEDTDAAVAAMVQSTSSGRGGDDSRRAKASHKFTDTGVEKEVKHRARELATLLDTALVQALLLSQQSAAAVEILTGLNYCDVDSCEEMMLQSGHYTELLQLYKYNEMHRKVLNLLNHLAVEADSCPVPPGKLKQVGPESIIDYLKKLGGHDSMLILESSAWLLKHCPEKAVNLFTSTDPPLPANLVNSYLKEKAPGLQAMYLEHLMINDPKSISLDLQNELVQIYLDKVLEEQTELQAQGKWDEHEHTDIRQKLLVVLESSTVCNPESLLKRLPTNGLHEERAILLGKMGQHQLALTLYAHKLHEPDLALKYCDRVFLTSTSGLKNSSPSTRDSAAAITRQTADKAAFNIYLTLLQVYLNPMSAVREFDRTVSGFNTLRGTQSQKVGIAHKTRGHVARKIAQIEGADDSRQSFSSNDSAAESGKSDGEDFTEKSFQPEGVMLDDALNLLSCRWDHIEGAQALRLLPSETKLQLLLPFLEPLLRKSSEARRNLSVIKSLHQSENLQVHDELQNCRKRVVKITSERTCSICHKRIGSSVFAVYPNETLVHFVCYRDHNTNNKGILQPTAVIS